MDNIKQKLKMLCLMIIISKSNSFFKWIKNHIQIAVTFQKSIIQVNYQYEKNILLWKRISYYENVFFKVFKMKKKLDYNNFNTI